MIVEFSVKNYRSIKELQTLSMVAAPIKSKYPELDTNNVIPISDKLSLLKSVAIYGANGSGKSNLIKALIAMMVFIRDSFSDDKLGKRIFEPFELNSETPQKPTFFQLVFIHDEVKYRYGFEVFQNEVKSEWLFGTPGKSEIYYFIREGENIRINEKRFSEGKGLIDKTSVYNLFLNIVKAFNGKISAEILKFIIAKILISPGITDHLLKDFTIEFFIEKEFFKNKVLTLMNIADSGIQNISNREVPPKDYYKGTVISELDISMEEIKRGELGINSFKKIVSEHPVYNNMGEKVGDKDLLMEFHESDGTQKFFNYSGVITFSLMNGSALFLDEFDARLHPMLTKKIVEMFNSPNLNKNGAQLVFVTHDTNLLDNSLLRRDQIYFTEKNKMQETVLYSLADFKGVRNDASYEKDYINGKFGAIPFLGDFEKLFQE